MYNVYTVDINQTISQYLGIVISWLQLLQIFSLLLSLLSTVCIMDH